MCREGRGEARRLEIRRMLIDSREVVLGKIINGNYPLKASIGVKIWYLNVRMEWK